MLVSIAAILYRFPSRKLKVIGITGTNGKSTVVEMVSAILEEAGYKIAISSSIKFKLGKIVWRNESRMTMPGKFFLQKLLRNAVSQNCQYAVIEVSSEGIKQHRHRFINFNTVIITNVTPEHIESHGSFDKYLKTKGELFRVNQNIHIINFDDSNSKYFINFPSKKKYIYGINVTNNNNQDGGIMITRASYPQISPAGTTFRIDDVEFNLKLLGKYNIYNALAAISLGLSQRIDLNICKNALNKIITMPGRMDEIISHPFKVFVDYAVTPDSLEKAYQTIKDIFKGSRMVCVLGSCGGGRDKWKRPILGKLAKHYCDYVIITNEDPYDENPSDIINEIAKNDEKTIKILDRRNAISEALKSAKKDDIIIITGKGCESSMCVNGGIRIPWDEKQVVIEEFTKLFDNNSAQIT